MITTLDFRKIYTFAAGASVATYPVTFTYQSASEVSAELTEPDGTNVPLVQGADFSVSAGPVTNGTLTKIGVWDAVATQLTIYRVTPQTNTTDLVNGAIYDADTAESSVDELTQMVQELQGNRDLALVSSITDPSAPGPLPTASSRANHFLGFDASGDPIAADPTNVPVTAYMKTLLDDATDVDGRNTLGAAPFLKSLKSTGVDYTILVSDGFTDVQVNALATITLPPVATYRGRSISITNISASSVVTIGGTVDGILNPTLVAQYHHATLISDGTLWHFKAYGGPLLSSIAIKVLSADYTILVSDGFTDVQVNALATITLPPVATSKNRSILIKNTGTAVVTIGGTIDGVLNPTLDSQYDYAEVESNGATWNFKAYISHGSNSNGSWIKFGNGLMNCWAVYSGAVITTLASGSIFYSTAPIFTFPVAFKTAPFVVPLIGDDGAGAAICGAGRSYNITLTTVNIQQVGSLATSSSAPGYYAVGPWK